MKKIHYLILLTVACLLSASCNSKKHQFVIGVSQCSDDNWRKQLNDEISREAMFYGDMELIFANANDNNETQIAQIEEFIDQKVDLIIVSPNESKPITPSIEAAFDKGIPVLVVDRKSDSKKYTAYIGADNFEIGVAAGEYLAERMNGKCNVLELCGLSGTSAAIERHEGFTKALSKYPNIKILHSEYLNWKKEAARDATGELLDKYPSADVIFAHNDQMAYGAHLTVFDRFMENSIVLIGVDALSGDQQGMDLVARGYLEASFLYPTGGDVVIKTAHQILAGEAYVKDTKLSTAIISGDNVRISQLQVEQIEAMDRRIETLNVRITNHRQQNTMQKYLLLTTIGIVILVLIMLFWGAHTLRLRTLLNIQLNRRNNEISNQKDMLEQQRDKLIALSTQLEEATQSKLTFFTNISHEFCTPLTLIAAPIDTLISSTQIDEQQKASLLSIAQRNINILLRLVGQILDFRRFENGKAQLNISKTDLKSAIDSWNSAFIPAMRSKGLVLKFAAVEGVDYTISADINKIERVYYNLLSNALKYAKGTNSEVIEVSLYTQINNDVNCICFKVTNVCVDITPEHTANIFNRFYQINNEAQGAGIGLSLAKAYVELHEGTINVECLPNHKVAFSVQLPVGDIYNENYPAEAIAIDTIQLSISSSYLTVPNTTANINNNIQPTEEADKPLVLVVDDNEDICRYIALILQKDYQVISAYNGSDGFQKAVRYIPDVIVSDIMMPVMDGIEMCGKIKAELITSHIPVLMLTACALDEKRIEGFANGADAYIQKPFKPELLLVRVKNLITNRQRVNKGEKQNIPLRENNTKEEENFLSKFEELIDKNITNTQFGVEDMSAEMGLSRVQLYRKVKALTSLTPNEILRISRLKKGDLLLRTTSMTISEIAYEVGFSAPSYFSKCYKEQFGVSPTHIQEMASGENS